MSDLRFAIIQNGCVHEIVIAQAIAIAGRNVPAVTVRNRIAPDDGTDLPVEEWPEGAEVLVPIYSPLLDIREVAAEVDVGWSAMEDGSFTPPVEPDLPVPVSISDRQFFQQLAIEGTITETEALAAVKTGDVPAILQIFIDAITDPAERFAAEMLLSGATEFRRDHPLTDAIGLGQGRTLSQMDDFFRAAGAL